MCVNVEAKRLPRNARRLDWVLAIKCLAHGSLCQATYVHATTMNYMYSTTCTSYR